MSKVIFVWGCFVAVGVGLAFALDVYAGLPVAIGGPVIGIASHYFGLAATVGMQPKPHDKLPD